MCCPENFVKKTKSCSLVTQKGGRKGTKIWFFVPACDPHSAFCGSFCFCRAEDHASLLGARRGATMPV